jgi:SnoaL-like domain
MWDAYRMPWAPELFSAAALARLEEARRREVRVSVPYYAGLLTGETDALIGSFTGEPELHDPVRGRIKGVRAFAAYVTAINAWFEERKVSIEEVDRIVMDRHGVEEDVVHFGGEPGPSDAPVAITADKTHGRIDELRVYHSTWSLTGRHANRPPLLQSDPDLRDSDVVGEYQRALAAGDVDAITAAFEPDGYAREPAGGQYVHRGRDGLRAFYESLFSNGGGIPLEHCALIDDGRACALEYNVVRWGKTELPPQAGVAVYVRGQSGKLAAARIYDDADPPLGVAT